MSERLQITVPSRVAAAWRVHAEMAGVSLSNWVAAQVAQADIGRKVDEILSRADSHSRYLGEIAHALVKERDESE